MAQVINACFDMTVWCLRALPVKHFTISAVLIVKCILFKTELASKEKHLPSNLIPKLLAGNDGDFFTYPLVGVEIQSETSVILLNNNPRRFLHGLGPDTTL